METWNPQDMNSYRLMRHDQRLTREEAAQIILDNKYKIFLEALRHANEMS